MLASISIGALWSNAAPEFGRQTILDRFSQIKPKCLFVVDGYQYGGKSFNRREEIRSIVAALSDSLEQVVFLPYLEPENKTAPVEAILFEDLLSGQDPGADDFNFDRVPADHPLWVLFSSGTTGLPKAIVHHHVGALMQMMLTVVVHVNLKYGDIRIFYTTTGWVMFDFSGEHVLNGSTPVLYDGHPTWPQVDVLWKMAADFSATFLGASATYVNTITKPWHGTQQDLSILSFGQRYVYRLIGA